MKTYCGKTYCGLTVIEDTEVLHRASEEGRVVRRTQIIQAEDGRRWKVRMFYDGDVLVNVVSDPI